jgi:hypothetical protein
MAEAGLPASRSLRAEYDEYLLMSCGAAPGLDWMIVASFSRLLGANGLDMLLANGGRWVRLRSGCLVKLRLEGSDEIAFGPGDGIEMLEEVPRRGGESELTIVTGWAVR